MKNYAIKDRNPLLTVKADGSILIFGKPADANDFQSRTSMVDVCKKYGITVSDFLNVQFQLNRNP